MNSGEKLKPVIVKHFVSQIANQIDRQSHNSGILHGYSMSMDVWESDWYDIWGENETRKCKICKHFAAQIAHQVDRQSHISGILREIYMSRSMDVLVREKRINPARRSLTLRYVSIQ